MDSRTSLKNEPSVLKPLNFYCKSDGYFFFNIFIDAVIILWKKSVDIDQTRPSMASDQELYCLHLPLLWDVRH